jgi:hypothetical protein
MIAVNQSSRCGGARLTAADVKTAILPYHGTEHALTIEVQTLTREQAEALRDLFVRTLEDLEFPR